MQLVVSNDDKEYGIEVYKISLSEFKSKEYHPFIATQEWESITIEVSDDTPRGVIRQLIPLAKINVILKDIDNITPIMMQVLCEIYPGYSAKLRSSYASKKLEFKQLVTLLIGL